jgi:hypothetical protein
MTLPLAYFIGTFVGQNASCLPMSSHRGRKDSNAGDSRKVPAVDVDSGPEKFRLWASAGAAEMQELAIALRAIESRKVETLSNIEVSNCESGACRDFSRHIEHPVPMVALLVSTENQRHQK